MSIPDYDPYHEEEEVEVDGEGEEVFLNDDDVIQEIPIDEEDLPDRDDGEEMDSDAENEVDDSVYAFRGHTDEVYTVACNPEDASMVATGGKDDRGFLWRIGSENPLFELGGHEDTVSAVAFSFNGQLLATGGFDGIIKVWDVVSGRSTCSLEGSGGSIEWLKWHSKGNLILAGSEDASLWLWNADRGALLNTFSGHAATVTCGDFTPDGRTICTGSDDATLKIWNPRTGQSMYTVRGHPYHTDGLTCLSVKSDSTIVITGSKDGSIHMVNIETGRVFGSLSAHSSSVECIGFSTSGHPLCASGSMDQKLIIWDLQHSLVRFSCDHEEGVTCLLWLGPSQYVASGCVDGKVRVWDSLSGQCMQTFNGHTDVVQSLAMSKDGKFLVSVSSDGTARIFEISKFLQ